MKKIKDIEDKGLRELAILRLAEGSTVNDELYNSFGWCDTIEGFDFWEGVNNGTITTLNK